VKAVQLKGGPPVHPWVYSKRLHHVPGGVSNGDLVALETREGRACGYGFFHRRSLVAVRVLSYDPAVVPDGAWLRARLRAAERLRTGVLGLGEVTDAWRMVHGEGDGLSGLVVDRYGEVAVVSLYSLGWHRRFDEVARALREEAGIRTVVARVDRRTSTQEGFDLPPADAGEVEIHEHGVRFWVQPAGGHKTGFFVDQRENRARIANLARGRRVFDGMCYTGGFALAAAAGGAAAVRGVDLDEDALAQAAANAALNGVSVEFTHADVFSELRALAAGPVEARPDLLIVDPAKWAKERAGLAAAMHRYADLNRLALEAVAPGGLVLTNSCSGLVGEEAFLAMLRGVALDTRREVCFLHVGGAGADHPVAAAFPEGRYLKSVLLTVGPPGSGPGQSTRGRTSAGRPRRRGGDAARR
jgi:23S rRNA (cytosine1962-C5)-methyltransferase